MARRGGADVNNAPPPVSRRRRLRAQSELPLTTTDVGERVLWSLGWLSVLLASGYAMTPAMQGAHPLFFFFFGPTAVLVCLAGIAMAWTLRGAWHRLYVAVSIAFAVVITLVDGLARIRGTTQYLADEGGFNQYTTSLLLHGHNPYTANMQGALGLFSSAGRTFTMGMTEVLHYSYPAGSLWMQALVQGAGVHHLPLEVLGIVVWAATGIMLAVMLPPVARGAVPIILFSACYAPDFLIGTTDSLLIPFVMLAVWQWDRFSDPHRHAILRWLGPVGLGLACSIKQGPWFCVPFLVVGIALEARRVSPHWVRDVGGYVAAVIGSFTAVNAPFMIMNWSSWWRGAVLPLTTHMLPSGAGIVNAVFVGLAPGAHLALFSYAGGVLLVTAVLGMALYPEVMKRAWLFVIPLVFFFVSRSFITYYTQYIPAALVAATTISTERGQLQFPQLRPWRHGILTMSMATVVTIVVLAFANPTFTLRINDIATKRDASLVAVNVTVTNTTGSTQQTSFALVGFSERFDVFLTPQGAYQVTVGPHQQLTVELHAKDPRGISLASSLRTWRLEAVSASADSLSNSAAQSWHGTLAH